MGWRASAASVRAARALARSASSAGASTSASSAGAVTGAVGEADWRGRWRSTRIGDDRCPFHPGRTAAGAAVDRDHSRWMVLLSSPTSFASSVHFMADASAMPAEGPAVSAGARRGGDERAGRNPETPTAGGARVLQDISLPDIPSFDEEILPARGSPRAFDAIGAGSGGAGGSGLDRGRGPPAARTCCPHPRELDPCNKQLLCNTPPS